MVDLNQDQAEELVVDQVGDENDGDPVGDENGDQGGVENIELEQPLLRNEQ